MSADCRCPTRYGRVKQEGGTGYLPFMGMKNFVNAFCVSLVTVIVLKTLVAWIGVVAAIIVLFIFAMFMPE